MADPKETFAGRSWSTDGKRLVGVKRGADRAAAGLLIYAFESGKFERLTDFGVWPQFLHDGRRVLFPHQGKIYVADSVSKKVHEVLSVPPHEVYSYRPSLSPDQRLIYFGLTVTEADVWLMSLE
jgi:Tol biopolymer transport system component